MIDARLREWPGRPPQCIRQTPAHSHQRPAEKNFGLNDRPLNRAPTAIAFHAGNPAEDSFGGNRCVPDLQRITPQNEDAVAAIALAHNPVCTNT